MQNINPEAYQNFMTLFLRLAVIIVMKIAGLVFLVITQMNVQVAMKTE